MRTPCWVRLSLVLAALAAGAFSPGAPAAGAAPRVLSQLPSVTLPENWEARGALSDAIFAPVRDVPRAAVLGQQTGSPKVSFFPQYQADALYLVFANQEGKGFPIDGAGTFIIKRSLRDGSFLQAKVFLQDDPGCFLRLYPDGDRTRMDTVLFNEPFQTGVPLPVSFTSLLTSPMTRIMQLTSASVDWPLLLAPAPGEGDRRIAQIVQTLRSRLPGLRDLDDGAMDASGRMVLIATGDPARPGGFNCSGFAKWVADGFFAPLAGHAMEIAPLKARDAGIARTWSARFEEIYDPYFGLDWSRGLAKSLALARTGVMPTDAEVDVRDDQRVAYVPDVGYPVTSLQAVLYFLARAEPGVMYLGSVNAPSALAVPAGIPTLRQHHHVVVLLPWFDAQGTFTVTVMERNVETSLASLQRRYGTEYVHLVRIPTDGIFDPPPIPPAR
jgi:hypothetical protein